MPALDLPVKFGNVSIGETTARLAAKFDREAIDIDTADDAFCERRLIGRVVYGHVGDAPGQTKLLATDDIIEGAFDIKGFSVSTRQINAGLTFAIGEIDVQQLARFAGGAGRMIVDRLEEIPAPEKGEREESVPLFEQSDAAEWESIPLDEIFDPKRALRRRLREAGLNTLGELAHYTDDETRELVDIEGIGPKAAEEIESTLEAFWSANPQYGG